MEGNIYNNITKEINFQLPDIYFDSDSDDFIDGEPIKPYIRPPAEVLFGTDDSESEEILSILSKLPQGNYEGQDDNQTQSSSLSQHKKPDNNTIVKREIPFNDIQLSYDIQKCRLLNSPENRESIKEVTLSKFGVRGNIDLDKVLEEMDLSNCRTNFFDDILTMKHENDLETIHGFGQSELMKKLDEISKQYENKLKNQCSSKTNNVNAAQTHLLPDTSLSTCNNNNNNDNYTTNNNNNNCYDYHTNSCDQLTVSLANLFDKAKQESVRKTTYLDLRTENRFYFQPTPIEIKPNVLKLENLPDCEPSSDESDEELKESPCLWIDNYRKFKSIQTQNLQNKIKVEVPKEDSSTKIKENDDFSVETMNSENLEKKQFTVQEIKDKDDNVPEHVKLKIEKIKHQEKILSERRRIVEQLNPFVSCSDIVPTLIHEEISFGFLPVDRLIPEIEPGSSIQFFNAFVTLQSPHTIMTVSKVSSPLSVDHAKEHFIALLSLMLRSMEADSPSGLSFRVHGLQQINYENQLQLAALCSTELSLTMLRSDLKKRTLANLSTDTRDTVSKLSTLPLSHIFRIQPYDATLNGNIWQLTNASIGWHRLSETNHQISKMNIESRPLNINTSCVAFRKDFYLSLQFDRLLDNILNRFTVVGLRYFPNSNSQKSNDSQIILALRGFDAIETIKSVLNTSVYKNKVSCTENGERSLKELCKFFGPTLEENRLKSAIAQDLCQQLADELNFGLGIYHNLYWTQPSDIILLVSPLCLDVGWIINILQNSGGYVLINICRLKLSLSKGRQIGIPESSIDYFESKNGVCHLIVLRNENPFHPLPYTLEKCMKFMVNQETAHFDYQKFFFASYYSNFLIDILDTQKSFQIPDVRELNCDIMEPPFEDCEKIAFVLIISDELTKHVSQILDQMTNLDLLAVKCFSNNIKADHMALLMSQFNLQLSQPPSFSETESELKMRIGVFVVRSMYMIQELDKISSSIKKETNLVFAYTLTTQATFRMIGSFFTSSELTSDPRRRSLLQFLPESIISDLDQRNLIAQVPLLNSSIETVFVTRISNASSVLQKFRKICLLLTKDDFEISSAVLDENRSLFFIVKRTNAVYFLSQWTKRYFSNDKDLKYVSKPNEMELFLNMIHRKSSNSFNNSINDNGTGTVGNGVEGDSDSICLLVDCDVFLSSEEMSAQVAIFWRFFEDNKYLCHGLSIVNIDESVVCKLKNLTVHNLCGKQLKKKAKYLCLLLTGKTAAFVACDLIKSNLDFNKCSQKLYESIYYNTQPQQISQCCHILLDDIVCKWDNAK